MDNRRIAEVFGDIARLLELRGDNAFTVRAYRLAAVTIEEQPSDLGRMLEEDRDLTELPGIGKAIAKKIGEMVDTSGLQYYERLKAEFPEDIVELMRLPGIGPKTVGRLWSQHGITSIATLQRALDDGTLSGFPGLSEKTVDSVRRELSSTGERV